MTPAEAAELRAENARLREALGLAREWGVHSRGYHARQSYELGRWIDGGMQGAPPVVDSPFVRAALTPRPCRADAAPAGWDDGSNVR